MLFMLVSRSMVSPLTDAIPDGGRGGGSPSFDESPWLEDDRGE